jgi:PIN domain-containing protein
VPYFIFSVVDMRKTFPGYYRPTDTEFRKLWDKCLFVLDANVLLNLYRYSEETRKRLIDILQQVESRIWVPHQAAMEYQRNRLDVISAQREAYKQIGHLLDETAKKLEAQLRTYKRHPLINAEKLATSINEVFAKKGEELKDVRQQHPDLLENDLVREALTKLLDGKVGAPYSDDRLKQIFKDGEDRYAKSKPPGYKDAKTKEGDNAFGDLILWYQVMDKAAADKVPVIIVTDDVKEDWWWRHEGKIVGPNPDLVEEIRSKANVGFYMYVSDQFMVYARQYLKQNIDQKAIDEIREVRKHDEQQRLEMEHFLRVQEKRMQQFSSELHALASEIAHTRSEMDAVTAEMEHVALGPDEGRQSPSTQNLVDTLSRRRTELEARIAHLEQRQRHADREFHLVAARRNSLVHHGTIPPHLGLRRPTVEGALTAKRAPHDTERLRVDKGRLETEH